MRSHHWRVKSQLIYECRHSIEDLYQLDQEDPTETKDKVEWLLEKDRFLFGKPDVCLWAAGTMELANLRGG